MNDYLWSIAARALSQAPVVRPRFSPIFGPPDRLSALPDMDFGQDGVAVAQPTAESPTQWMPPQPVERVAVQIPLAAAKARALDLPSVLAAIDRPRESEPTEPALRLEREPEARLRPDPETPLARPGRRQHARREENDRVPPEPATVPQESASPPRIDSRSRLPELRAASDERPRRAGSDVATILSVVPGPLKSRAGAERQSKETAKSPEARPRAIQVDGARVNVQIPIPASAIPEPAPSIQVTIGRIEVRATPPVQQVRAPSPKPTSPSLEEYLKRRMQGGGT